MEITIHPQRGDSLGVVNMIFSTDNAPLTGWEEKWPVVSYEWRVKDRLLFRAPQLRFITKCNEREILYFLFYPQSARHSEAYS